MRFSGLLAASFFPIFRTRASGREGDPDAESPTEYGIPLCDECLGVLGISIAPSINLYHLRLGVPPCQSILLKYPYYLPVKWLDCMYTGWHGYSIKVILSGSTVVRRCGRIPRICPTGMTQGAFVKPFLAAVLAIRRIALLAELHVLVLAAVAMLVFVCHFSPPINNPTELAT